MVGRRLDDKLPCLVPRLCVNATGAMAEQHAPVGPGSFPSVGGGARALKGPEDVSGLSD